MTTVIAWRANVTSVGPKAALLPGRFHKPSTDNPRYAVCGVDLARATFVGGNARDERCRRCLGLPRLSTVYAAEQEVS